MATKENAPEKLVFQAEVKQLLHLMIHSLYSNKEIVIRELISNASDAADKLRFEALKDASLYEKDSELKIRLSFDKKARTLTISDNGIGMNRDEVMIKPEDACEVDEALTGLHCGGYGSSVMITATFGFMAASLALKKLL